MEVVALESSGNKRKNLLSMEDKAAALQQKGKEMQQKADHTRACLIKKYSAAAREYAKKSASSTWCCGTGASKNSNSHTRTPIKENCQS